METNTASSLYQLATKAVINNFAKLRYLSENRTDGDSNLLDEESFFPFQQYKCLQFAGTG